MVSTYTIMAIGLAAGIAIGLGIGFGFFTNTSGLEKQIQEQNSKRSTLESELAAAKDGDVRDEQQNQSMQSMSSDASVTVPPVRGFYSGQEILFIHTEASDPDIASMLTMMMDSPVFLVPSLKDVPASSLDSVYVFTNGIKGGGPFGFQPDVFSSVPTDSDYTPLREVKLVSWNEGATAMELRSVEEILDAEAKGGLTVSSPSAVVNMPIVKWPAGQR